MTVGVPGRHPGKKMHSSTQACIAAHLIDGVVAQGVYRVVVDRQFIQSQCPCMRSTGTSTATDLLL